MSVEPTDVQKWVRDECPIFGVYSPSGEGKTTFAATLFDDDDYWPVLYIDADEGVKTIAKFTNNKKICDYRSKSKRPKGHTVFQWFANTLKEARTSKHKSIVIEGFTRFRDNLVSDYLIDNPEHVEKPRGIMTAYAKPSQLCGALFGGVSAIQDVRKRNGTGVPLTLSFNTSYARFEQKGQPTIEYPVPNLSPNLTQNIMGRSDLFAEMTREAGQKMRLRPFRSKLNKYRKARNAAVAKALADMRDPNLPDLLSTWARVELHQTEEVAAWATDDEDTDTPEDSNE